MCKAAATALLVFLSLFLYRCSPTGSTVSDGASPSADGGQDARLSDSGKTDGHALDGKISSDAGTLPTSYLGPLKGKVVDKNQAPVVGALVRVGGREEVATSDASGSFDLVLVGTPADFSQFALTAGKAGYFSAGVEVLWPEQEQVIVMEKVTLTDNPNYTFKDPDQENFAPHCIHCHMNQQEGWRKSAHANAASNQKLHDLYNGTASGWTDQATCEANGGEWKKGKEKGTKKLIDKCYVTGGINILAELNGGLCGGPGQLSCDNPSAPALGATGPCADCHAPAQNIAPPGKVNLNQLEGLSLTGGIHCDFCHKIQEVKVNQLPGMDGAITLLRPADPAPLEFWSNPEVYFGPLSDVTASIMGNIYNPTFRTSEFCSACHQWSASGFRAADKALIDKIKWPEGLPLQDTYDEWKTSSWAQGGTQCRNCHMPTISAITAASEVEGMSYWTSGVLGWPRAYGEVRSHGFLARQPEAPTGYVTGPGDVERALLREPLTINTTATRDSATLELTVQLTNGRSGHSLPTGTPSRRWILLVQASAGGDTLVASGGYTIPAWLGAYRQGVVTAADLSIAGNVATLAAGSWSSADVGRVLRLVLASGQYDDYPGTRYFGAPGRTAQEKGLEIHESIGEAIIVAIDSNKVTLSRSLGAPAGALYFVGDPAPTLTSVDQTQAQSALAGAAGYAFGKVMLDKDGARDVHFFRAVEIMADNRIPPGATATTKHRFDLTGHASDPITVRLTLLHRSTHFDLARERGWQVQDSVRQIKVVTVNPNP
jgi:hypothetical protein